MANGKDSWNKAMLIDPGGRNSSKSSKKVCSSAKELIVNNEGDMRSEKRSAKEREMVQKNTDLMTEAKVKKQKLVRPMREINKRSTHTNFFNSEQNRNKTPLEGFDVKAFFEENLYDIIDLEENRSGVKEFEDAVKKDE